jgi:hypothetical protein
MTVTDLAGLPAEIRASLARAGLSQESVCDNAGMTRSLYYRRQAHPGAWRLSELTDLLAAAGYGLRLELAPLGTEALTEAALNPRPDTRR